MLLNSLFGSLGLDLPEIPSSINFGDGIFYDLIETVLYVFYLGLWFATVPILALAP